MGTKGRIPVSVIIPAYCAEAHLADAIRSVTSQTCAPAEIIVVDDASPDKTSDIATALGVRVVRLPQNGGPAAARNAGVALAVQPWIAFLDADDVWLDGKLAAQWQAICRWPDVGFCFTDYDATYADGHVSVRETAAHPGYAKMRSVERSGDAVFFTGPQMVRGLVRSMFVRQSSVIVNRALHLACGGYDQRWRLGEDYDYFLRLSGAAPAIAIERSLVTYRRRAGSLSADPLAEFTAIDALWTAIVDASGKHTALTVAQIRTRHAELLRRAAVQALRLERFREGADFASRSCALRHSIASTLVLAAVRLLETRAGSTFFRNVRGLWHGRHGRAPGPTTAIPYGGRSSP